MTAPSSELAALPVPLPERVAAAVAQRYGDDGAAALAADPWALLALPGATPGQADALASALGVGAGADGRRGRALAGWLLGRAARAGHTAAPAAVLASGLAALGVPDPATALAAACDAGEIVDGPDGLVALAPLAAAEDTVAEALERLLVTADDPATAVTVVTGCCSRHRAPLVRELAGDDAVLVAEAQRLDVTSAAALLEEVPDGARLVLDGDPAALPSRGPGQVLADLAAAGLGPVRDVAEPSPDPVATPDDLAHAVRAGTLPEVASPDHAVVALAVRDDGECVARARQLVTVSVPRAFGVPPEDVVVASPLRRGPGGVDALTASLPGSPVLAVDELAAGTYDAVVLVLPASAAGVLTRPLVHAAAAAARRHVSVVHATGPALPRAVTSRAGRRRTTRLSAMIKQIPH